MEWSIGGPWVDGTPAGPRLGGGSVYNERGDRSGVSRGGAMLHCSARMLQVSQRSRSIHKAT